MDITQYMEPELRVAFERLGPVPERFAYDVEATRRGSQARLARFNGLAGSPHPDVERGNRTATVADRDPVEVRVYRPVAASSAVLPAILFLHGGGFVAGGVEGWDHVCDRHARTVDAVVVSVEYRLPPEHPFPAGLEDCYTALRWLAGSAAGLGADPARIAVVGESSGGGIAAALALLARDRDEVAIAFQMPLRACLDDRLDTRSAREIVDYRTLHREMVQTIWGIYLGELAGGDVPAYAAAGRADDVSGLPPAYLAVGQLDVVCDENIDYARRLIEAGVPTELHVHAGAIHNFENLAPGARISADSHHDQARALIRALHPTEEVIS